MTGRMLLRGAVMKIGDVQVDNTGVRLPRLQVEDRPAAAVTLPQKVEIEQPKKQGKAAPPIEVPKIESVTRQIDSFLRSIGRTINFRVDQGSGRMVISVLDATTGELIRQVPGEDALRLAESIEAGMSALVDETA
jgi:flagellar protein FlaG